MDIRRGERVQDVVRLSALCVFFSIWWYLLRLAFPSGPSDPVSKLVIALIGGFTQGLLLGVFVMIRGRQQYRRAFVVGGKQASDDERAAAVVALRSGQLPVDPRQREAAVSFARYQLGRATNPWPVGVGLGLLPLVLALSTAVSPRGWLLAAFCIGLTALVIVSLLRRRQRARALLVALPFETEKWRELIDGPG